MKDRNELPKFLYRAVSKKEYAEDFVERGIFLMRLPDFYKTIEDHKRKDPMEGSGHIKAPGEVTELALGTEGNIKKLITKPGIVDHQSEVLNCWYLSCYSSPEVDLDFLRNKFGPFVIKINNPVQLAEDVTNFLSKSRIPIIGQATWEKVLYDKGLLTSEKPSGVELAELCFLQKAPEFSNEKEYRLVVITQPVSGCSETFKIEIGEKLNYVELI